MRFIWSIINLRFKQKTTKFEQEIKKLKNIQKSA